MSDLLDKLRVRVAARDFAAGKKPTTEPLEPRLLRRCAKKVAGQIRARGEIAELILLGVPKGDVDADAFDAHARLLDATLEELDPEPKK